MLWIIENINILRHSRTLMNYIKLVLMKIKFNNSSDRLGVILNMLSSYVARICHENVENLSKYFSEFVFWRPAEKN